MSVPEGKMRYDMVRTEVFLVASLLNDLMRHEDHAAGPSVGSEALRDLVRPILGRMNLYLEAVHGSTSHYSPRPPEADLG